MIFPNKNITKIKLKSILFLLLLFLFTTHSWDLASAGYSHLLLLTSDQRVFKLGMDSFDGESSYHQIPPHHFPAKQTIQQIHAGYYYSLVLTSSHEVYGWGTNMFSNLCKDDSLIESLTLPTKIYDNGYLKEKRAVWIGGGTYNSMVLFDTNELYSCGGNEFGNLGANFNSSEKSKSFDPIMVYNEDSVLKSKRIIKVASKFFHTLLLTDSNEILGFGRNDNFQIGDGVGNENRCKPVLVFKEGDLRNKRIVEVVVGGFSSFALSDDGQLFEWGLIYYDTDTGDAVQYNVPKLIDNENSFVNRGFKKIFAGLNHFFAIDDKKRVYGWGLNEFGQIGDNTFLSRKSPFLLPNTAILNNEEIQQIFAGYQFSVALTQKRKILTFGENQHGQLQNQMYQKNYYIDFDPYTTIDPKIILLDKYGSVSFYRVDNLPYLKNYGYGYLHGVQLQTNFLGGNGNDIKQMSINIDSVSEDLYILTSIGELFLLNLRFIENYNKIEFNSTELGIPSISIVEIKCGGEFCLLLNNDSHIIVWGSSNKYGSMGINSNNTDGSSIYNPKLVFDQGVLNGKIINQIDCGYYHSVVLSRQNNEVFSWGDNSNGKLGADLKDLQFAISPVKVKTDHINGKILKISCGQWHTLMLTEDNQIWSFGLNSDGQLGDGTTIDRYYPVKVDNTNFKNSYFKIVEIYGGRYNSFFLTNESDVFYFGKVVQNTFDRFLTDSLIPLKMNFFDLKIKKLFVSKTFTMLYVVSFLNKVYSIGESFPIQSKTILEPGYLIYKCFGDDSNVACKPNGECVEEDKCVCAIGYTGEKCQLNYYEEGFQIFMFSFSAFLAALLVVIVIESVVIGVVGFGFLILVVMFFGRRYTKLKKNIEIQRKLFENKENRESKNRLLELSEEDFKIPIGSIKDIVEIGCGSSAFVFKGRLNDKFIALKIFKSTAQMLNNEKLNSFKKELQLNLKLKNKKIVNFVGFVAEGNKFGIVLEYCENGNLRNLLENNKKISWEMKIKILLDISKGMEYLHFKKLIHRDLKLENVLLTKKLKAKISDFGISKMENEDSNKRNTIRVGTSFYMAPEVTKSNCYSNKCDIFSFSIIMFQVLTNKINNIYEDVESISEESSTFEMEDLIKDKKLKSKFYKYKVNDELTQSLLIEENTNEKNQKKISHQSLNLEKLNDNSSKHKTSVKGSIKLKNFLYNDDVEEKEDSISNIKLIDEKKVEIKNENKKNEINDSSNKKIEENNLIEKVEEKKEIQKSSTIISKEEDFSQFSGFENANIELMVANDSNFRPKIPKKILTNSNYNEFIDLMKKCWKDNPDERPNFNEISLILQEIFEKIKQK